MIRSLTSFPRNRLHGLGKVSTFLQHFISLLIFFLFKTNLTCYVFTYLSCVLSLSSSRCKVLKGKEFSFQGGKVYMDIRFRDAFYRGREGVADQSRAVQVTKARKQRRGMLLLDSISLFPLLFQSGPQPMGWYCPHSRWVSPHPLVNSQ
jgi:hypothetical protein